MIELDMMKLSLRFCRLSLSLLVRMQKLREEKKNEARAIFIPEERSTAVPDQLGSRAFR